MKRVCKPNSRIFATALIVAQLKLVLSGTRVAHLTMTQTQTMMAFALNGYIQRNSRNNLKASVQVLTVAQMNLATMVTDAQCKLQKNSLV